MTAKDLYKGSVITVYSRQLTIVDYGDKYTAGVFEGANARTVLRVTYTLLGGVNNKERQSRVKAKAVMSNDCVHLEHLEHV